MKFYKIISSFFGIVSIAALMLIFKSSQDFASVLIVAIPLSIISGLISLFFYTKFSKLNSEQLEEDFIKIEEDNFLNQEISISREKLNKIIGLLLIGGIFFFITGLVIYIYQENSLGFLNWILTLLFLLLFWFYKKKRDQGTILIFREDKIEIQPENKIIEYSDIKEIKVTKSETTFSTMTPGNSISGAVIIYGDMKQYPIIKLLYSASDFKKILLSFLAFLPEEFTHELRDAMESE